MLSVVVIFALTMLVGMVINVGRHVDDKLRMQNAADAATYTGGIVLTRGMNVLSFSNHLLCDVFALTAFMREARDRNAESLTPDVLAAWSTIGPIFSRAQFPKFQQLGPAITHKVQLEQELVHTYGEMSAATAALVLPVLEYVLRERLIPEFERAVVQTMPVLAQQATSQVAMRHGMHLLRAKRDLRQRGPQSGVLWRTRVIPVAYPDERDPVQRTLPAIDPEPGASSGRSSNIPDPHPDAMEGADYASVPYASVYLETAVAQREYWSKRYLETWIVDRLAFFHYEGKMSQFINLWRVFTCGQLMKLLNEEYATTNLPHILRFTDSGGDAESMRKMFVQGGLDPAVVNQYLDQNFSFVGVVYRNKMLETSALYFRNRLDAGAQTYAQVRIFIPRARLLFKPGGQSGNSQPPKIIGGGFGIDTPVPYNPPVSGAGSATPYWAPEYSIWRWEDHWDLWNQLWTVQLVPAQTDSLVSILQSQPPSVMVPSFRAPFLGGVTSRDLRRVSPH